MLREMFSTKLEDAGYAGWNRRGRALSPTRHFYRYVGDVPESPESAARLFCGR